jgi:hypothetical protein
VLSSGLADRAALNNFMQSVVPFDIATCMYYTGLDPFTKNPVHTAKNLSDRKMQRALLQFFKPENYFEVREALIKAGRADLIDGCEGLIPAHPPDVRSPVVGRNRFNLSEPNHGRRESLDGVRRGEREGR